MPLWAAPKRRRKQPEGREPFSPEMIDVEFERTTTTKTTTTTTDGVNANEFIASSSSFSSSTVSSSLLQLSLDAAQAMDADWNTTRIPFVDTTTLQYIDVKLAFLVTLDGIQYGIGVPFDHAAAITLETTKSDDNDDDTISSSRESTTVTYFSPDNQNDDNGSDDTDVADDTQELIRIMATQLQEQVSDQLHLKQTPRVLTIQGPLSDVVNNWQETLLSPPVAAKELREQVLLRNNENDEDDDADLREFHAFMKEQLGETEYQQTMKEEPDELTQQLMELFEVPGLGDQANDEAGMMELLESLYQDVAAVSATTKDSSEEASTSSSSSASRPSSSPVEAMLEQQVKTVLGGGNQKDSSSVDLDHAGVAIKLVSFRLRNGKAYSLVHLVKPFVLVGKMIQSKQKKRVKTDSQDDNSMENEEEEEEDSIRFELLTKAEEKLLIPRLEDVCKKDLEEAGLQLQ